MPIERSAGIIIFKNTVRVRRYLVLHAARNVSRVTRFKVTRDFWDFAKGVLDKGETAHDAARREAGEEAGIKNFKLIPNFKETAHYFTRRDGKPIPKYVAMFLAEVKSPRIKLSWEHDKYEWLPYEEAYARITLPPMRKVLEKAEIFLNTDANIRMKY